MPMMLADTGPLIGGATKPQVDLLGYVFHKQNPDRQRWRWFGYFDLLGRPNEILIPLSATPRMLPNGKLVIRVKAGSRRV